MSPEPTTPAQPDGSERGHELSHGPVDQPHGDHAPRTTETDDMSTPQNPEEPELDLVIPDDISSLLSPTSDPELAVLVTQIAGAEPLAAACSLAQLEIDAVPTEIGALAVLHDLTGDAPQRAAAAVSTLVKGVPLILLTRRGEQLSATRWQDGVEGDVLAPGLVLGGAPEELEDLVTGQTSVAELSGVVPSAGISRWKAMRLLTSTARKARKK
ncbi:hypothetical protein [Oerskovia enterophila]|uniref:Uncharacterized protein n=1 Tax=Oerskovia enterophila TaxID=43678 RepID=A0A163T5C8_9CELL|nr:hypothetical protein [Oerskovia enterophila]KZM37115.1 hypothetical protein OJAG_01710 [Oerskovia enterophila]